MTRKRRLESLGWVLFIICAGFYLYGGIVARDAAVILGSAVFLAACFLFIIAGREGRGEAGPGAGTQGTNPPPHARRGSEASGACASSSRPPHEPN